MTVDYKTCIVNAQDTKTLKERWKSIAIRKKKKIFFFFFLIRKDYEKNR